MERMVLNYLASEMRQYDALMMCIHISFTELVNRFWSIRVQEINGHRHWKGVVTDKQDTLGIIIYYLKK